MLFPILLLLIGGWGSLGNCTQQYQATYGSKAKLQLPMNQHFEHKVHSHNCTDGYLSICRHEKHQAQKAGTRSVPFIHVPTHCLQTQPNTPQESSVQKNAVWQLADVSGSDIISCVQHLPKILPGLIPTSNTMLQVCQEPSKPGRGLSILPA